MARLCPLQRLVQLQKDCTATRELIMASQSNSCLKLIDLQKREIVPYSKYYAPAYKAVEMSKTEPRLVNLLNATFAGPSGKRVTRRSQLNLAYFHGHLNDLCVCRNGIVHEQSRRDGNMYDSLAVTGLLPEENDGTTVAIYVSEYYTPRIRRINITASTVKTILDVSEQREKYNFQDVLRYDHKTFLLLTRYGMVMANPTTGKAPYVLGGPR